MLDLLLVGTVSSFRVTAIHSDLGRTKCNVIYTIAPFEILLFFAFNFYDPFFNIVMNSTHPKISETDLCNDILTNLANLIL